MRQRTVIFFENLCKELISNSSRQNVNKFNINSNENTSFESSSANKNNVLNPNQLQQILNEINNLNGEFNISTFFLLLNLFVLNL